MSRRHSIRAMASDAEAFKLFIPAVWCYAHISVFSIRVRMVSLISPLLSKSVKYECDVK